MTIDIDTGEGWPTIDCDDIITRKSLRNVDEEEIIENMIIALSEIKEMFNEDDLPTEWDTTYSTYFKMAWFNLAYSKLIPVIKTTNNYKSGDDMNDEVQTESTRLETRAFNLLKCIPGFSGSAGSSFSVIDPDPALI